MRHGAHSTSMRWPLLVASANAVEERSVATTGQATTGRVDSRPLAGGDSAPAPMRAALALLLALGAPAALASPARRCPGGTYVVDDAPLMSAAEALGADAIVIDGRRVSIASGCPPVHARVRHSPRGTTVRVVWESCGALAGEVRLKARIDRACRRMTGLLKAGGVRRRFAATRFPT